MTDGTRGSPLSSSGDHLSETEVESDNHAAADPERLAGRRGEKQSYAEVDAADDFPFTHPLLHRKTGEDVVVTFDGPDDPYRPLNWPTRKKVITTVCYGVMTAGATWETSVYSSSIPDVARTFGVSQVVATLGTSLFLFGFGVGPLLWAPLSEVYGRKLAVQGPFFVGICFAFGEATAQNFQTLMLCRFFGGFFSAAPLVNTGGVLADLYTPRNRAAAMVGYQMSVIGGPLVAPVIGGAIVDSYLTWRWTGYITGILMSVMLILHVSFVEETFAPALLTSKARALRHKGGNYALHAHHDEWDPSLRALARKYLVVPFRLLFTPICAAMCVYGAFVYSLIYVCYTAFPIEFQEVRGWNSLVGSLPFLGTLVGCVIGGVINLWLNIFYLNKLERNNGVPIPEARLYPMMVGGVLLAAGLFIFGWTSSPDIPWIGPVIGAAVFGAAFITTYQSAINYLVDTFQQNSASAVAANTVCRSMLAGGFPLFTDAMFHNLGINWASSLLGFIAVVMIPIPFLLYYFGARLRARGKWSRDSIK